MNNLKFNEEQLTYIKALQKRLDASEKRAAKAEAIVEE